VSGEPADAAINDMPPQQAYQAQHWVRLNQTPNFVELPAVVFFSMTARYCLFFANDKD